MPDEDILKLIETIQTQIKGIEDTIKQIEENWKEFERIKRRVDAYSKGIKAVAHLLPKEQKSILQLLFQEEF